MADLGLDLGCVSDLTDTMSTVSGRRALAESVARRLQTPRGRLIKHPNYGFDLTGEINDDVSPADLARIESSVEDECMKEERVLAASARVTFVGGLLTVLIILTDAAGPFVLVLSVSGVTVSLVSVSP